MQVLEILKFWHDSRYKDRLSPDKSIYMQYLSQQKYGDRIYRQLQILNSVDLAVNGPGLKSLLKAKERTQCD